MSAQDSNQFQLFPADKTYFRTWRTTHQPAKRWRERKVSAEHRQQVTKRYINHLLQILGDDGGES